MSPAGLVAKAGRIAEPVIAQGMARMGAAATPGLLAKATAAGVVGAAEAGLYGAGQALSEAAHLGDPQLAGELLMSKMGGNALLGGGAAAMFSLGTGAIGKALMKGREWAAGRRAVADASSEAEAIAAAQARARAAGETSSDVEAKIGAVLEESPSRKMQELFDEKTRQRTNMIWGQSKQDELADIATKARTRMNEIRNDIDEYLTMEGKIRGFQRDMAEKPPAPVAETVAYGRTKVLDVIENLETYLAPENIQSIDRRVANDFKKLTQRFRNDHLKKIEDNITDTDPAKAGGRVMGIVDDVKRRVDKLHNKYINSSELSSEYTTDALEDMADALRYDLEDMTIWGEGAAGRQIKVNRAWVPDLALSRARTQWLNQQVATMPGKSKRAIRRADRGKILRGIKTANNDLEKESMILRESSATEAHLLDTLVNSYEGVHPRAFKLLEEFKQNADTIQSVMKEAAGIADDMDGWDRFVRQTTDVPGGGIARKLVVTGAATANQISRMNVLAETTAGVASRVKATAKAMVETGTKAAKAVKKGVETGARGVKEAVPFVPGLVEEPYEDLKDRYNKAVKIDMEHQTNLGILHNRIYDVTQNIADVAPETTVALAQTAVRASEFMRSKMVIPPIRPSDVTAHLSTRQRIPDTMMAKYLRYREGLDPIQALDKMKKGKISREGAEAFRTVYPQMFALVESEVMNGLVTAKEPLPYENLIHLSILLGRPLHPSLEPGFIASMQKMHARTKEERKPPQARKIPDMASNQASRSQQLV